ncbi:MAG: TIM barrel protein [Candidatus Altiarchaeota archaeon]
MRVGIKVMHPSAEEYLHKVEDCLDFIEAMAIDGEDCGFLHQFRLPVIIHNMHFTWGVNFANPKKGEINRRSLEYAIKLADEYDARHIIVHPERHEDDGCSEDQLVKFLSTYRDDRIIIESMPYFSEGARFYGYDRDGMKRIMARTGRQMCLDFPHTSEAAVDLGKDPLTHVKDMMRLNPAHYHLSDTHLGTGKDEHTHLGEGNLPMAEYKKLIPKTAWVTLETPHDDPEKTKKDIEYLKS